MQCPMRRPAVHQRAGAAICAADFFKKSGPKSCKTSAPNLYCRAGMARLWAKSAYSLPCGCSVRLPRLRRAGTSTQRGMLGLISRVRMSRLPMLLHHLNKGAVGRGDPGAIPYSTRPTVFCAHPVPCRATAQPGAAGTRPVSATCDEAILRNLD